MIAMKIYILLILILSFTTSGCKKNDKEQINQSLLGEWILTSVQDVKTNQIIYYPDIITKKESVTFTDSASVFLFHGVCNCGVGQYLLLGNSITINSLFTTQIACKNGYWEDYLRNNLNSAFSYTIDRNKLVIYSSGTYNLVFNQL
jgi:heat shock protein HslJ